MAKKTPKRQWKSENQCIKDKRAGVTDVLVRAAHDESYRARLLSKKRKTVKDAFNEEGNFEKLPKGFRIECFEREGYGVKPEPTDNTVMLVLPELSPNAKPKSVKLEGHWNCTYLPYPPERK